MAISISLQTNPIVSAVGTKTADATIINSDFTSGRVDYEIRTYNTRRLSRFSTGMSTTRYQQIVSVTAATLTVILKHRTKYQVRVSNNSGSWSDWTTFTTRDKRYQSPDAITQLTDNTDDTARQKNRRRIVVTNSAKATTTKTARGARVVNTDLGYVGTTSITKTSRGARVVTDTFYSRLRGSSRARP